MPTISMFYGLVIRMLFMDTQQHNMRNCTFFKPGQRSMRRSWWLIGPWPQRASQFSKSSRCV